MEDPSGWLIVIGIFGLIALAFLIGGTILQVILSKNENKWLGYILPIVSMSGIITQLGFTTINIFPLNKLLHEVAYILEILLPCLIVPFYLLIIYLICRRKLQESKRLTIAVLIGIVVFWVIGFGLIKLG